MKSMITRFVRRVLAVAWPRCRSRTLSDERWDGWNVEWSFAGDERITYLWGGDVHQDGASVTVGNGRFNGRVKPGHRTTFGFLGTTRSSALPVDDLWVDGRRCAVAG
jgi:hypothetical protein